jgi:hypothetical protein
LIILTILETLSLKCFLQSGISLELVQKRICDFMSLFLLTQIMSSFLIALANLIIPTRIIFSKCLIKQVISPAQWGCSSRKMREVYFPFSTLFLSIIMILNKPCYKRQRQSDHLQHSSFFIFDTKDKVKYPPFWFDQWWILFGAETSTMHSLLSDKFESYAKNNHFPLVFSKFSKLLYFIVHYNIPWIVGCDNELSVDTSIK